MKRKLLLFMLLVGGLATKTTAQCDCGTGADGAFVASSNTTLAGGTYNYTSFTIDAGVTVTVTGTAPLVIHSTGDITVNGTLNLSGGNGADGVTFSNAGPGGIGVAGGHNGGDGYFDVVLGPEPGLPGMGPGAGGFGVQWYSGGGGGYGSVGMNGDVFGSGGGAGGIVYGETYLASIDGGSGGASGSGGNNCGSGAGGAGGGILIMRACGTLTIGAGGMLLSNGGNGGSDGGGNCGGGGGGAGGSIWLIADALVNNGMIQANGGIGGSSSFTGPGGNGGAGRIRLDYTTTSGTGTVTPAAGLTTTLLSSATTYTDTALLCFGDMTATANTTASGGGGFYQYSWTGGQTTANVTNLGVGANTVTVTDTNGCTVMDTVTVTSPPQLASTGSSTDETTPTANDGTATVTVTGGIAPYTYLWTPGGGTTNPLTGLDTGSYIVTITDDNGCTMMDTVHVSQATSVYSTLADKGISVYPNPAGNYVTIASSKVMKGEVVIQLTDNLGRVLATERYNNTSEFTMNTSSYATGNYLLRISAEGSISNVLLTIRK